MIDEAKLKRFRELSALDAVYSAMAGTLNYDFPSPHSFDDLYRLNSQVKDEISKHISEIKRAIKKEEHNLWKEITEERKSGAIG